MNRQIRLLDQLGPGRIGHAFGPDVKAAAPALAGVLLRRDLPKAPDAFAFVVALVEHVVLGEITIRPVALAVGERIATGDCELADPIPAFARKLTAAKRQSPLYLCPP